MAFHRSVPAAPPAATASPSSRAKWRTLLAACLGLAMLYIDLFIVNVALPAITRDFHAPLSAAAWTISGFVLMIAVLPMGLGRLADIWGQRRLYLVGLALFVGASIGCAFAPTIGALIAFRVLQGVGAAIMTPATLAITMRAFPEAERGFAPGIYGGVAGFGLVAGPVLGGLLVHGDNWRGIFLINAPLGLIAIVLALLFIPEARDDQASPVVDWWGLLLLSSGLGGITFALTQATSAPWLSLSVLGSLVSGAALLALFVAVEARVPWPLIDLALFRNGPFVLASLSFFLFSAALFGSQPYWSLFMQNYWGFSPLQGGLAFVPPTLLIASLTPFTGILGQRAGPRLRLLAAAGVLALGGGCLYAAGIGAESTYATGLLPALVIRGFGIPLFSTCATLAVLQAVPLRMVGLASGALGMARNVGSALGVAVFGIIYHQQVATLPSQLGALPPDQLAEIVAAADNFLVAGQGAARAIVATAILQGFDGLCLGAALFCAAAALAVLLIRPRPATPRDDTGPVASSPLLIGGAED